MIATEWQADELLFRAGDGDAVDAACQRSPLGKLLPNALSVHRSALDELEPLLRVYEGCARAYLGEIEGTNLIKLHRFSDKVSYLDDPAFETDPHPALSSSVKLNMRSRQLDFYDYRKSDNPPVLHRKESFLEEWANATPLPRGWTRRYLLQTCCLTPTLASCKDAAMRRSPRRRTSTVCRAIVERIACLSLLLRGLLVPVRADDSQPGADPPVDHPILVVAAASIDRLLLERPTTLLEVAERDASPAAIRKMLSFMNGEFLTSLKGIDTTKPLGALVFFGFSAAQPKQNQKRDESRDQTKTDSNAIPAKKSPDESDPHEQGFDSMDLGDIAQALDSMNLNERAVFAIPMKDFDELIASLGLTPVAGEPHAYQHSSGNSNSVGVRRSGDYLLVSSDLDLLAHAADPRSRLRSVLGKQDVAVSFQTKGLPVGLRTLGAEGIKSVLRGDAARLTKTVISPSK